MKTKTTFNINFDSISNSIQHVFDSLQASQLRILSKKGEEYLKMPLIIAIIIGIIFPVAIIVILVFTMLSFISLVIEREVKDNTLNIKQIDNK